MKQHSAFTLIELLVVITIIVVLLALLTPALDRAVYEAEMAVCMSHLHAIGQGTISYAMDHKRHYPHRPGAASATGVVNAGGTWLAMGYWHPHAISNGAAGSVNDDRVRLRNYMGINGTLTDPLSQKADLDGARSGWVYSSYYLWFGWHFAGQKGMDKMGDRFTYTEASNPPVNSSFDLLAGDHDDVRYLDSLGATTASHSDSDGRLVSRLYENDRDGGGYTLARWDTTQGIKRGTLDMNFVFTDAHVERFNGVVVDDQKEMVKVPVFNGADNTLTQWTHLPGR